MSRRLIQASAQRINGTSPLNGPPMSMSCWFYSTQEKVRQQVLMFLYRGTNRAYHYQMNLEANNTVRASVANGGSENYAVATTLYKTYQWHHVCSSWKGANNKAVWLDGGGKGINFTGAEPTVIDSYDIGWWTASRYLDGKIADCAIWNVALEESEVIQLSRGVSPFKIRNKNLVSYFPLMNTDADLIRGVTFTPINSPTWAEHPSILLSGKNPIFSGRDSKHKSKYGKPEPLKPIFVSYGSITKIDYGPRIQII